MRDAMRHAEDADSEKHLQAFWRTEIQSQSAHEVADDLEPERFNSAVSAGFPPKLRGTGRLPDDFPDQRW